jgi:hypothetical protein
MKERAHRTEVIDLDTGEKLSYIIWANDNTGRYRRVLTDENGVILYNDVKILNKVFTGRIMMRDKIEAA